MFVVVDHFTTECIGLHAAKSGNRFEAWSQSAWASSTASADISDGAAREVRLRHDHGSNYVADDFRYPDHSTRLIVVINQGWGSFR